MSERTTVALTHLADFLTVGAHGILGGSIEGLLALDSPVRSWPAQKRVQSPAEAYQEAVTNATAAHLLDWDDVMLGVPNHPGTIIWPALLASARPDATVRELCEGFLEGVGVAAELSRILGPEHYARGWHATATIGRMAAAYAAALTRFGSAELAWRAMQLAAIGSSGVTDVFGTAAKPVQVGLAAGGAVHAALLAPGMNDMPDVLAPDTSLGRILGVRELPKRAVQYGSDESLAALRVKAYPCCFYAHAPVLAAVELFDRTADLASRGDIVVKVNAGAAKICKIVVPTSVDEARFSIPYLVAAAEHWSDGALGLLDGTILTTPSVAAVAKRVVVEVDNRVGDMATVVISGGVRAEVDLRQADPDLAHQTVRAKAATLPTVFREPILACVSTSPELQNAILDGPVSRLRAEVTPMPQWHNPSKKEHYQ